MCDVNDDSIKKTINKIHSDKDPINWLIISYADGTTDKFILFGSGSGGLTELTQNLNNKFIGYGYLRIENELNKKEPKFFLIQIVGKDCTPFQIARILIHKEDILQIFKPITKFISASELISTNDFFELNF